MKSGIRVGFGQADITPNGRVSLYGQFCLRFTDKIHSSLQATALCLESHKKRTIWVSCDLIEIVDVLQQEVSDYLQNKIPDFKPEQLILSATHVHTAPYFTENLYGFGSLESFWSNDNAVLMPESYRKKLVDGIGSAVMEAYYSMEDCCFETAVSRIQTGYCRRITYKDGKTIMYGDITSTDFAGIESHDGGPVNLIYFRRLNDRAITGVIANVPCPAQVLEGKNYVSSDYWGYVCTFVKEELGENVKLLGLCGSAGDLSPRDLLASVSGEPDMSEEDGCISLAKRIFDEIIRLKDKPAAVCNSNIIHNHICIKLKLPIWKSTKEDYEEALDTLEKMNSQFGLNENSYKFPSEMQDVCRYAWAEVSKLRYEDDKQYKECVIHGVLLGDVVFITSPFELFVEYVDRIRAACQGKHLFDVQLSCDFLGYLPTRKAVGRGGYSACIDNGLITPEGGELLVSESIRLINSL